jgi:hypothetical protein
MSLPLLIIPEYVERTFEPRSRQRAGPFFSRSGAVARASSDAHWHERAGCLFTVDPASTEGIMGLRVPAAAERRELVCAVCLADFEEDDDLRRMPCSHSFHRRCIFRWLRISGSCPCCRFQLPSEDEQRVLNEQAAHGQAGFTGNDA